MVFAPDKCRCSVTLDKRIEICYAVFVSMKEAIGRECPAFFMVFFCP